jgi:transcriptional regulator with XRE-family HTH domain
MPQRGARGFRPDRLRARRLKLGLTQVALAKQIGVNTKLVDRYEAGAITPGGATLQKLSTALQVEPVWLAPLPRNPCLADYRDRLGLTQPALAELLGISSPMVSHTERGMQYPADVERWAEAYGINRIVWIKAFTTGRTEFFASRVPTID